MTLETRHYLSEDSKPNFKSHSSKKLKMRLCRIADRPYVACDKASYSKAPYREPGFQQPVRTQPSPALRKGTREAVRSIPRPTVHKLWLLCLVFVDGRRLGHAKVVRDCVIVDEPPHWKERIKKEAWCYLRKRASSYSLLPGWVNETDRRAELSFGACGPAVEVALRCAHRNATST